MPGALTATLGVGALVYTITAIPRSGWASTNVPVSLCIAALLLMAFVFIERRSREPLIPITIFQHRNQRGSSIFIAIIGSALTVALFFHCLYLQQGLGQSALLTGLCVLPFTLALTAGTFASRPLVPRRGARTVAIMGGIIATGGVAWLSTVPVYSDCWLYIFGPTVVIGLGVGLTFLPLTVVATTGIPAGDAGIAAGIVNMSRQLGGAIGLAVFVSVAASITANDTRASALAEVARGYNVSLLIAAGLLVVAVAITPFLQGRPPREPALGLPTELDV